MQGAMAGCARPAFFGTKCPALTVQGIHTRCSPPRPSAPLRVEAAKIGPGKKWEHYELNDNGKPLRIPMHVKTGDVVQVIAGDDRGKVGKIVKVHTKIGKVLIEGVNVKTKHVKPQSKEEAGQVMQQEYPIHHSNVAHYSEAQKVASRIGHKLNDDGKKVRFLKKTGEVID
ncbi:PRPL24 [Auxenochlorella protothecoides x Auxenochlorella symbiontica]|uniref:KOW domain-containing protein n=2 Tax=Auxenochlorella protothecoides TaxID=3075 RepID=A0A1D2A8S2_AUXPR